MQLLTGIVDISMAGSDADTIDRATLNQLKADMGEDFGEIIPVFIESTEAIISALEQAFLNREVDVFLRQAHSLKSCSANLGGFQLSEQAATLELNARSGKMPDSGAFLQDIKRIFLQMAKELTGLIHAQPDNQSP